MAVTYGFFNSMNGDRKYNAEQMSDYFRGIVSEGVFQHLDSGLAVTAGTGLTVNVAAGRAIVQNRWMQNDASLELSISAASETYARIDAVVIRLDWSSRAISIAVKTGTPGASPAAPSLTRNSTTYEMALAYVNVAASATSVTVTDKRSDGTVCGWATVAQSTSGEVDAMLNAMKTGFDGVTYASPAAMVQGEDEKLQGEIDDVNNSIELISDILDIEYNYTQKTGTVTTDKYINESGVVATASTWSIETVSVTPGKKYKITARAYNNTYYFGYYDSSNNFISGLISTTAGISKIEDYVSTAPETASTLVVVYNTADQAERKISESGDPESAIIEEMTADISQNTSDISEILETLTPVFSPINGTKQTDVYINANGIITSIGSGGWSVVTYSVTSGKYYKISAGAYSGNYYFGWYNSNNEFISGVKRTESGTGYISKYATTCPQNATTLCVVSNNDDQAVEEQSGYKSSAPWVGKKWVVFGDSLTEENSRTTKHYFDYVAESTGISTYNMGNSGSGYMKEYDLGTAFYQRILNVPLDTDVITIFGSFNDLHYMSVIGTATDTGTSTIGGCINTTLDNLFSMLPLANIGIVTPTPWQGANPLAEPNDASAYVDLIIDICKRRSIPCLDLFHCSQLRPWDATFRTLAYSKDDGGGTHPDETGHAIIAPRFEAFLDSLLLH